MHILLVSVVQIYMMKTVQKIIQFIWDFMATSIILTHKNTPDFYRLDNSRVWKKKLLIFSPLKRSSINSKQAHSHFDLVRPALFMAWTATRGAGSKFGAPRQVTDVFDSLCKMQKLHKYLATIIQVHLTIKKT